ncbi:MAG: aminotransferase class I/II-fold pyridoxal phosphate-dependent enzyme [Eubacteriales bacterium]|nr:aminotransferase class I/II-fold pyridoxal phosphate-dependent enzyme [Eubacteriales bacterium]
MKPYGEMTKAELAAERSRMQEAFDALKARGLKLDMSRGKPGRDQLDLSSEVLSILSKPEDCQIDGIEARNYGNLMGLPSARKLFAEILGVKPEEVFVGGNASLTLMYDTVARAYTHGRLHSDTPWSKLDRVKFLCPAPGYDRHFAISQSFGMELITIPMTAEGPDMDAVEAAIKDPAVKGMWCVPKYSNPEGIVYSDATVRRIASMQPAAKDFLLIWDNAYCIHDFGCDFQPFPDILTLCREAGNPDMPVEFASTSKVTIPGAGVAVMAMSEDNLKYAQKILTVQLISADKVNQLRHVRFLKDKAHTLEHMKKQAAILRPKFEAVLEALDRDIAPLSIAKWNRPVGGYFISLDAMPGTAKRTLELAKEAGVVMTNAGATFPYGKDPNDSNIRIAPTMPPVSELKQAVEVFCTALRLAALEKLMA